MTLQQLEYIIALNTHRHFVNAAESCFVTQPTLTLQVQKLEEEMGTLIFDRSKQPLVPTKSGIIIIEKAKQILLEAKQLKEIINKDKDATKGTFHLAIIPTLAPYLLPLFLVNFSQQHPETKLIIHEMGSEDIIHGLNKNAIDIALIVTPLLEQNLREIQLFQEPFLIYTSQTHSLYHQKIITPQNIPKEGLWLLKEGHCFRNQVLNICNKKNSAFTQQNFQYESGSIETLKNLVKSNMGYTLVPELSVINEMPDPKIKRFSGAQPIREVSIVTHNSFTKEALIEKLSTAINENIPGHFRKGVRFKKVKWR